MWFKKNSRRSSGWCFVSELGWKYFWGSELSGSEMTSPVIHAWKAALLLAVHVPAEIGLATFFPGVTS